MCFETEELYIYGICIMLEGEMVCLYLQYAFRGKNGMFIVPALCFRREEFLFIVSALCFLRDKLYVYIICIMLSEG